ncbi:MAG: sigma-70 family RNA polymerase sigma factor [Micromonosporaceae bacterium]|nr:sigma-70 family RNA polymerase sigma factor [Micromonosporaceae bacterium]
MEPTRPRLPDGGQHLDPESAQWLADLTGTAPAATTPAGTARAGSGRAAGDLTAGSDTRRQQALARLHERLLRIALREVQRRAGRTPIGGPELTDIAHQATADAMLAILAKLDTFRGESRFTTWAYRFVILEVSSKLGRHYWQNPPVAWETEDWQRLPDRLAADPPGEAESREIIEAVRTAVDEQLTEHQRRIFVATVLDGVPTTALAHRLGVGRGAIYKAMYDARRKIRAALVAKGILDEKHERPGQP